MAMDIASRLGFGTSILLGVDAREMTFRIFELQLPLGGNDIPRGNDIRKMGVCVEVSNQVPISHSPAHEHWTGCLSNFSMSSCLFYCKCISKVFGSDSAWLPGMYAFLKSGVRWNNFFDDNPSHRSWQLESRIIRPVGDSCLKQHINVYKCQT